MTPEQQARHHIITLTKRLEWLTDKAKGKTAKEASFLLSEIAALKWALNMLKEKG